MMVEINARGAVWLVLLEFSNGSHVLLFKKKEMLAKGLATVQLQCFTSPDLKNKIKNIIGPL